jgi:hypothetical protein
MNCSNATEVTIYNCRNFIARVRDPWQQVRLDRLFT